MAKFSTSDLFVVVFPHTDNYSFDTESPDEVFTSKEEAIAYADELNLGLDAGYGSIARSNKRYLVETLDSRIETIKVNARYQGEENEARRR